MTLPLSHYFFSQKNYLQYQRQLIILLYMETMKLNPMAALQYGTRCSIELRLHSLLHFQTYTHPRDLYHLLYPLFTSLTLVYHDHENHIINIFIIQLQVQIIYHQESQVKPAFVFQES